MLSLRAFVHYKGRACSIAAKCELRLVSYPSTNHSTPTSLPKWQSQSRTRLLQQRNQPSKPSAQESTRESESHEHATTAVSESTDAMAPIPHVCDALLFTNHAATGPITRNVGCRLDTYMHWNC